MNSRFMLALLPLALAGCANAVEPVRVPSPPVAVLDEPAEHARLSGPVHASGWALHPQGPIRRVEVLLDGEPLAEARYGVARSDLCRFYQDRTGCPDVGWQSTIDLGRVKPGEQELGLRVTGPFGERTDAASRSIVVEARS